ncbi:MAG: bifunctional folylpolyglutamate synthase/dihydrofolate synthase [Bacteroidaceae bacterium]|nr:bifunctional folylpolyglutamate synthase/dihydrofolate synthase [Bacteroidaceae bacterium]
MTYAETIDYLYHAAPTFQNIGAGAYKEGLANTLALDEHFHHPHRRYRTIHVAGTNGKGSVSSTLAAILQSAGLKVGLYTSPHLIDFRERIRVNGDMIPEQRVVDFVTDERAFFEPLSPSFFELTTALAFLWFTEQEVDVAVVEVGLGGRLDCTNIIRPDLAVITNISFDHQQFLGNTILSIAAEKAGIIKAGVPLVVGETGGDAALRDLFVSKFRAVNPDPEACIRFADEERPVVAAAPQPDGTLRLTLATGALLHYALGGIYQRNNAATILTAIDTLCQQSFYSDAIGSMPTAVADGFANVTRLTALRGRWQHIHSHPTAVCDAGHNVGGITYVARQLQQQRCHKMHIVFGMVDDKDARSALALLPHDATYYFTQPSTQRALPAPHLQAIAGTLGLTGTCHPDVAGAYAAALAAAAADDFIFVGGSCYVVADLLDAIQAAAHTTA